MEDVVYYKHETRFDNGQLVDLDERRKVADKFPMSDPGYHDFLNRGFQTMRKGEVAYLVLTEDAHRKMYHTSNLSMIRTDEEKAQIFKDVGTQIWIKVTMTNIKRDPKCQQHAPWDDKVKYYEKVRLTGKELCEQQEWSNAKNLYARCIGLFKNISKA